MTPTYYIKSHPLLSDNAVALLDSSTRVFDAVAVASGRVLGLQDTEFTGSDAEDAKLAIVYQLNHELEQTAESQIYETVERGERRWTYRSDIESVSSKARMIAERLLSDNSEGEYGSVNSQSVAVANRTVW